MNDLTAFFEQYSIETIILFVVALLIVLKLLNELFDYFYNKIKKHFDEKQEEEKENNKINEVFEQLNIISLQLDSINDRLNKIEKDQNLTHERLQESTRSYLIDSHHKFVYQIGAIDDLNLQSIERRYLYYKNGGGNSFIDNLIEEIRKLPKINVSKFNAEKEVKDDSIS